MKMIHLPMSISEALKARNQGQCELCNEAPATIEYTVSPKSDEPANQVAICTTCESHLNDENAVNYWRCLEGSIWSTEPAVQALSYRLLHQYQATGWVSELLSSIDLDEETVRWAMTAYEVAAVHKDAYGNTLENGDTVVLTQALNVKGTNFTASKGTVVRKIKLVADNTEQIEGKINEQVIVILTKFVKKG